VASNCHFKVTQTPVDKFLESPLLISFFKQAQDIYTHYEDRKMTVINTNIAAQVTANAMKQNARTMDTTMERLATGQRINSASDDAAGLAIGSRMEAQIRGLQQATRNSNDAMSLLQTADGAAVEISDMLQRMRELAVQAQNGTNESADITNLNKEFAQLATEIDRIADDTKFNGTTLMSSGITKTFTVGADEADQVSATIKDFNLAAGADSTGGGTSGVKALTLSESDLRTDFALGTDTGTLTIGDGTTTISIDLNKIRLAAADGSIAANAVTQAQIATALNVEANASATFTATFAANGTSGFTITEKSAFQGSNDTYTAGGSTAAATSSNTTTGVAGAAGGVLGADLSAYKDSSTVTVDDSGVIAALDTAIVNVAAERANFGSVINRLEHTIDNLNSSVLNTSAAKSAIMDADYAAETTELARTQIISQAATAMLSQANQQAQSVLALLK
jgi:flagellin